MTDADAHNTEPAAWLAGHGDLQADAVGWPPGIAVGGAGELAWRRLHERALRLAAEGPWVPEPPPDERPF